MLQSRRALQHSGYQPSAVAELGLVRRRYVSRVEGRSMQSLSRVALCSRDPHGLGASRLFAVRRLRGLDRSAVLAFTCFHAQRGLTVLASSCREPFANIRNA